MKISNFKRINKEDFPEESRGLIDRIGFSINIFAQEITNILNKKISVKDNLLQDIITIDVIVNSSGIPTAKTQFKNSLGSSLEGCHVIRVDDMVNSSGFPTGAVQIFFNENAGIITIGKVTGLAANNKYRIKILTIGG